MKRPCIFIWLCIFFPLPFPYWVSAPHRCFSWQSVLLRPCTFHVDFHSWPTNQCPVTIPASPEPKHVSPDPTSPTATYSALLDKLGLYELLGGGGSYLIGLQTEVLKLHPTGCYRQKLAPGDVKTQPGNNCSPHVPKSLVIDRESKEQMYLPNAHLNICIQERF